MSGTLHLLPVPVATTAADDPSAPLVLPASTCLAAQGLRRFVVENARSARQALRQLGHAGPLQALAIAEWPRENKGAPPGAGQASLDTLLAPLLAGEDIGILSESGCPGIADPGARAVAWAQARGVRVTAHVGPSSILLALMASGLDGQRFAFHGYLPVEAQSRTQRLQALEQRSSAEQASQALIETPYRNQVLAEALLADLREDTWLCIATDLTGPAERVLTRRVADWRKAPPELPRLPTVFVFQAAAARPAGRRPAPSGRRPASGKPGPGKTSAGKPRSA